MAKSTLPCLAVNRQARVIYNHFLEYYRRQSKESVLDSVSLNLGQLAAAFVVLELDCDEFCTFVRTVAQ